MQVHASERKKGLQVVACKPLIFTGAGGQNRTDMGAPPLDFEFVDGCIKRLLLLVFYVGFLNYQCNRVAKIFPFLSKEFQLRPGYTFR